MNSRFTVKSSNNLQHSLHSVATSRGWCRKRVWKNSCVAGRGMTVYGLFGSCFSLYLSGTRTSTVPFSPHSSILPIYNPSILITSQVRHVSSLAQNPVIGNVRVRKMFFFFKGAFSVFQGVKARTILGCRWPLRTFINSILHPYRGVGQEWDLFETLQYIHCTSIYQYGQTRFWCESIK